jgi:hypothetical protein
MSQKRSFAVDTSSLTTAAPLIDAGVYAAQIINCSVKIGENNTICVKPEKKWDKAAKESKPTGDFIIGGALNYGVQILSKKAIQQIQRDEPKVFGGQIFINFDKTSLQMAKGNHVYRNFVESLGLGKVNFSDEVDWEFNENILDLPEAELKGLFDSEETYKQRDSIPEIVDKLNSVTYHRALFNVVCNYANNVKVKAKIVVQPNYKEKEVKENAISRGTSMAPFSGILPYEDNCENDLDD